MVEVGDVKGCEPPRDVKASPVTFEVVKQLAEKYPRFHIQREEDPEPSWLASTSSQ